MPAQETALLHNYKDNDHKDCSTAVVLVFPKTQRNIGLAEPRLLPRALPASAGWREGGAEGRCAVRVSAGQEVCVCTACLCLTLCLCPDCIFLHVTCLSELQTLHCQSGLCLHCRAWALAHINALVAMRASGGVQQRRGRAGPWGDGGLAQGLLAWGTAPEPCSEQDACAAGRVGFARLPDPGLLLATLHGGLGTLKCC